MRSRGGEWAQWVLSGALLLQLVTLYFTATRGAMLGLVGGVLLAVILIAVFERQNGRLRKYAVSGLVTLLVIIGGFVLIKDTQFVGNIGPLSRLATISLAEGETRFRVWNMAWEGVKERPILGWGQENFNFVFNKYYRPEMYNQEPWFDRVHNIFFDWLIAGGVLGLLSYFLLYATTLYYLWAKRAGDFSVSERSIFTGLLAGYFFHNLFVFDNIVSYILFFSLLAYLHFDFTKEKSALFRKEVKAGTAYGVVAPAALVLLAVTLYLFNWTGIAANVTLLKAIAPRENSPFENLELFKKALAYDGLGRQEVKEQMMQAASQVVRSDLDDSFKSEFFAAARDAMRVEIERSPNDARLLVFMGSYLNTSGDYDTALTYLERAREASPKKQAILFEIATSYLNKGDREKAFGVLREAYELAPDYEFAKMLYAVGAIYSGKNQLAGEILAEVSISTLIQDEQLLRAYVDTGQFNNVVFIWERRVENNPDNSDFRVSLAAAYLQVGEREKSIAQLRKAIELNPSFKEEGESYIREIQAGGNP
jgi:tetratricopeptide (TPR) repeat protein